ncbi:MAG: phosphoribosylamine--glycine ligase, partial [Candidatus Omnitrophica bacterium]|nr:phosphoribosylamine--glycine ligase [Candidatus Omnitrophota bacterium]
LEFNVRFGDPETQAILPRLKSDLIAAMEASIDGNIETIELSWDERPCICVVCASAGYPGKYKKGIPIEGLNEASKMEDVVVFHAGTASDKDRIITSGGRVLGVTAMGTDIKTAIDRAYKACGKINFEGMYYRKDIGRRALTRV